MAIVLLTAAFVSFWFLGIGVRLPSIAAGFIIAMASFIVLVFVVIGSLSGTRRALWVGILGVIKMIILGTLLWWLISRGLVEPLAFLIGFSTMVVSLVVEGIRIKGQY